MKISEAIKVLEKYWEKGDYHKVRKGAMEILKKHRRNYDAIEWLRKAEERIGLPVEEHHHRKHLNKIIKQNHVILSTIAVVLILTAVILWVVFYR